MSEMHACTFCGASFLHLTTAPWLLSQMVLSLHQGHNHAWWVKAGKYGYLILINCFIRFRYIWLVIPHDINGSHQLYNCPHITSPRRWSQVAHLPQYFHLQWVPWEAQWVYSVLIILSLLWQQLLTESGLSADLTSIINGIDSETIMITTTHIPSFGRDLQDLVHGYCSLDTLSSINIQMEVQSHPVIQLNHELLVVQLGENSVTNYLWALGLFVALY